MRPVAPEAAALGSADEVFDFSALRRLRPGAAIPVPTSCRRGARSTTPSWWARLRRTTPSSRPAPTPRPGAGPAALGLGATAGGPPKRPQRKKGGWIAFLLVLLLAVGAALGGWWYGVGRFKSTPDVISLSQEAARNQVEKAGLTFAVASAAYSETIKPGHVISTDPGAGDDVKRGGTVTAVISKGPERHDVPNLDGKTESEAITAINAASLTVATPERHWSEAVDKGVVISFTPKAGTSLKRGAPVHLVVSRGPRPIRIVDWTGKNGDEAEAALKEAGFDVARTDDFDDTVAAGTVISQTPRAGRGFAGDPIKLVVSKGPHLVEVPDVTSYRHRGGKAEAVRGGVQRDGGPQPAVLRPRLRGQPESWRWGHGALPVDDHRLHRLTTSDAGS